MFENEHSNFWIRAAIGSSKNFRAGTEGWISYSSQKEKNRATLNGTVVIGIPRYASGF